MENRPVPHETDNEDTALLFDRLMQGKQGARVPSIMASTMAERPDIFAAVMAAGRPILFEGLLPVSVKQMIVLLVAGRRGCSFCAEMHRQLLESMGIDRTMIDSCAHDPEMSLVPPTHRQIIQFAVQAADDPNHVGEGSFQLLRDSGLEESEILEVAMVAAFANFFVTWADVAVNLDD